MMKADEWQAGLRSVLARLEVARRRTHEASLILDELPPDVPTLPTSDVMRNSQDCRKLSGDLDRVFKRLWAALEAAEPEGE